VSYVILKSDGTVLTTIADGTINTTSTPLGLPGRLYPGYGQVIDTDVVHLLENFANSSPPTAALRGQLWYNTTNSKLYVAPTDAPASSAWVALAFTGSDATFANVTATGNIIANNAAISNNITANSITVNYATVTANANIVNANVTGNLVSSNLFTNLISTGAQTNVGQLIGTWTASGGLDGNALVIANGNLIFSSTSFGIKTNKYMWANGQAVSFDGTYTNSNVAAFLPVYTGDVGLPGGGASLYGNVLSTGGTTNQGVITGNWTVGSGSYINGLTNIPGTSINGAVSTANTAVYAVNVLGTSQPNIVSLGTLTSLSVSGSLTTGQIVSTVANGTAPLTVLSTTKVSNLNADLLDGYTTDKANTANTVAVRDSSGNLSATYFIGDGSQLTGVIRPISNIVNGTSNINIAVPNGTIAVSVNGVSNVLTISSSSVNLSGTMNATALVGNGSAITNINPANINGTVATANYSTYAGVVTTAAQTNITSLGNLDYLNVTGNINSGNVYSAFFGSGAGLTNINGSNVVGTVASATVAGTVTTAAQPNITSVGTLSSLSVTGNISGANLTGSHFGSGAGLTSINGANVSGSVANATYANAAGSATTATSATTAGTVTTAAQPNITSVGTLSSLSVTNTVTAANVAAGNLSGNGYAITSINGANVSGTVSSATTAGTASAALTAGTVTTNAQPNITSLGILSGLNVTGAASIGGGISVGGNSSFASGTQQIRDVIEQVNLSGTGLNSSINIDLIGPAVNYYTASATGNWTINFRGNSSVTANSYLGTGQSTTTTLLATIGASAYYPTAFTIDNVAANIKWLGGAAPVAGVASKVNVYTFTIVKIGSSSYTVFASIANYG